MSEQSSAIEQGVIPAEIRSLLDRRATIQEWLAKLDGLRDAYRPEVHARVSGDYGERLQAVEGELGTHRAGLEETLAGRRAAADDLVATRDVCAADLEETQLRHAVGEFVEDEFEERKRSHEETLADLDTRIATERSAIDELEGALSQIDGGAVAAAPWVEESLAAEGESAARADEEDAVDEPYAAPSEADEAAAAEGITAGGFDLEESPAEEGEVDVSAAETPDADDEASAEVGAAASAVSDAEYPGEEDVDAGSSDTEAGDGLEVSAGEDGHEEFMDELEFLESLSLDDPGRFDSITQMLEGDEEGNDARGGAAADDVDGG